MRVLVFLLSLALWIPFAGATQPTATTAAIAPYPSAPACAEHDDRIYHGVWDAALGCHYNHSHADNPHDVDDIFGTSYYAVAGGSISYPWQTPGENLSKHETYKWIVRRDLPCFDPETSGCITDFRAQVHADMFNVVSDFHSFAIEARLCLESDPTDCGILRWGGWQFAGHMEIDDELVYARPHPPGLPSAARNEQIHQASRGDGRNVSWYMESAGPAHLRVVHRTHDAWGMYPLPANRPLTSPPTLASYQYYCEIDAATGKAAPACYTNASRISPDLISVVPGNLRAIIDADGDKVADYAGYSNRHGNIVTDCTVPSLDCVPVSFEGVPLPYATYYRFAPATSEADEREMDIFFDGVPSGWIQFPN